MCEGFPRQGIENASNQTGRWLRNLVTYNEIKIYLNPTNKDIQKEVLAAGSHKMAGGCGRNT
jgi:hypothetical protein